MKTSLFHWRQWSTQVRQLFPTMYGHRTKTLAFFVFGLVLAGSARLPVIAEDLLSMSSASLTSLPDASVRASTLGECGWSPRFKTSNGGAGIVRAL